MKTNNQIGTKQVYFKYLSLMAIAFSPNSRFLATATWSQGVLAPDKAIIVWELEAGKPVLTLPGDTGCKQVLFDPTGKILYGACGRGIQAWDFPSGETLFSFASEQLHEAIALSPDGTIMATVNANLTGESSNMIQLWRVENQEAALFNTLEGHGNDIAKLEFTANGSRLVSSSYDGKIKAWDWKNSAADISTNNLYSKHGVFSLSANSRLIAGNFGSSSMANLVTGLPITSSLFPQTRPHVLAFSPKLPLLAWGGKSPQFSNPIITLWTKANETQAAESEAMVSASRKGYSTITLAKYWGENQRLQTEEPRSSSSLQSPVGINIEGMALDVFGLTETVESEQQQVEVKSLNKSLKTVTITQTSLPDDSVTAIRYRVDFAPFGDVTRQQWRVIWAGRQTKCQPNRGHQDWSSNRCQ